MTEWFSELRGSVDINVVAKTVDMHGVAVY